MPSTRACAWGIDYDLWLRLSAHYEFDFIPQPTARYRMWSGQMSKNYRRRYESAIRIMQRFLEHHPGSLTAAADPRGLGPHLHRARQQYAVAGAQARGCDAGLPARTLVPAAPLASLACNSARADHGARTAVKEISPRATPAPDRRVVGAVDVALGAITRDRLCGNATDARVRRDILEDDRVGTDRDVVTDVNATDDLGTGRDDRRCCR